MDYLGDLIKMGFKPAELKDILEDFADDAAGTVIRKELSKIDTKIGSKIAENFGRGLTKTIDEVYEMKGVSLEDKDKLAKRLAANGALQLAQAAEMLASYPQYASAVAGAKVEDNATKLEEARGARKKAQDALRRVLINMGRALTGFLQ